MHVKKSNLAPPARRVEHLGVKFLHYDPQNPRLPGYVDRADEKQVIEWMLKEADVVGLMQSIGEQGYFEGEPLTVVPVVGKAGEWAVIEGNRRLTAVKLLHEPGLATIRKSAVKTAADEAKHKPAKLPVLKFEKRSEVLRYLAYRHITGVEAWNPLQKARYLKQLAAQFPPATDQKGLHRQLAREIGSNSNYVARALAGLAVYETIEEANYFDIPGLGEKTLSHSVLTTALTYADLAKFIGLKGPTDSNPENLNREHLKKLTRWMFEENDQQQTRLGESRNLQMLARVVVHEEALKKFEGGAKLVEADLLTSGPIETFRTALGEAKTRLEVARDVLHVIEQFTPEDGNQAKDIQKLARLLASHVDSVLMDPDVQGK